MRHAPSCPRLPNDFGSEGPAMVEEVFGALLWFASLTSAVAPEAPLGLSWGPVTDVPKPSMVDREANVTALIYLHDRPLAAGADTDRVILEVCRDEGLQQVIWLSRPMSEAELPARFDAIYREGVRRLGQPRTDDASGDVLWSSGQVFLTVRATAGERRLAMVSRGPRYGPCSVAHEAATGHPASAHGARLVAPRMP